MRKKSTKVGIKTEIKSFILHVKMYKINPLMINAKNRTVTIFKNESRLILFVHKNAFYNVKNMLDCLI